MLDDADVYAYPLSGDRYDCGSKLGYLQATVAYALAHDEIGDMFRSHLREIVDN
jgi:UTP--glucose-1-phosphate uridylyltransferase